MTYHSPKRQGLRVEREVGTGSWIVTRYQRFGWTVLHRGEDEAEAHRIAQQIAHQDRDFAMERR